MADPLQFFQYLSPFAFGLIIGSFLNVVIHRIPQGESIVQPGSHCPSCGKSIKPFDNIPVLSYILLQGKCRHCGSRISLRYPLVELITGAAFAGIVWRSGFAWEASLKMIFAAIIISLVFIDARHRILPNIITYPAIIFAFVAAALTAGWGEPILHTIDFSLIFVTERTEPPASRMAIIGGALLALAAPAFWLLDKLDLVLFNKYFEWAELDEEPEANSDPQEEAKEAAREKRHSGIIFTTIMIGLSIAVAWIVFVFKYSSAAPGNVENAYSGLIRASVGALIGGAIIWWLRAIYFYVRGVEGMGLGDVKMIAVIGAFFGWQGMFSVMLLGSIIGVVIGIFLIFRNRSGLKTALPFGVCLGIASLVILLLN